MKLIKYKNTIHSDENASNELNFSLNIKLRFCVEQDLEKLEWFGMFYEHREIFRDQFQRHLKNENLMLIAEFNEFPVGQVWIDVKTFSEESTALIWALRVHPIMQNLGLGTFLIKKAESIINAAGYNYSQIEVEKNNVRAKLLYERLGYNVIKEVNETSSYSSPDGQIKQQTFYLYRMKKKIYGANLNHKRQSSKVRREFI